MLWDKTSVVNPAAMLQRNYLPEAELRALVVASLLWEPLAFEQGGGPDPCLGALVPRVRPERVAALAVEARLRMHLRFAPFVLVREMARHKTHRGLVATTLERVILDADDLVDFVSFYWKDGRVPLSAQVKKGLAAAFPRFDEAALAACCPRGAVTLRDVLFLCHARPLTAAQAGVWKKLIWRRLSRRVRHPA